MKRTIVFIFLLVFFYIACQTPFSNSNDIKSNEQKAKHQYNSGKIKTKNTLLNVSWLNLKEAKVEEDVLISKAIRKNKWGFSGASSKNKLLLNENGFVQTTIKETNQSRMFGLTAKDINPGYGTIDYAIYLNRKGRLIAYEKGRMIGEFGKYKQDDIIKIEKNNNKIFYKINELIFYKSSLFVKTNLVVDVAFFNQKATIYNAQSTF